MPMQLMPPAPHELPATCLNESFPKNEMVLFRVQLNYQGDYSCIKIYISWLRYEQTELEF
jgi:hypothetical protein